MSHLTPEVVASIKDQLAKSPNFVSQLTEEETLETRRAMSPLGSIVSPNKRWANLSICNYKEAWMRKFYLHSVTGYLFRLAQEYSPEEEIETLHLWYDAQVRKLQSAQKPTNTDGENDIALRQQIADLRAEEKQRVEETETVYREFLNRFLCRHFTYNPDHHLRKMHNDKGPQEQAKRAEMIKERCTLRQASPTVDDKLKQQPEKVYTFMRNHLLDTYQFALQTAQFMESALCVTGDTKITLEEQRGILNKRYGELTKMLAGLKKIAEPISQVETYEALARDLPADLTCHFDRYVSNHYEALREITNVLANETVDIEFSVVLYDVFKSEKAAHEHLMAHEKEFVLEPITVENQGQTLLGPFKENRERANFYNQRTDLLLKMHEQQKADQRLAEDIKKKKVEAEKRKEIQREGPDKSGLTQFSEVMNGARAMGAGKILDKKTMEKLEAERRIAEDSAVPKKAIQVDVYKTEYDDKGVPVMRKSVLYTREEPLKFLEPNSPYAGKYLPVDYEEVPALEVPVENKVAKKKPKKSLSSVLDD